MGLAVVFVWGGAQRGGGGVVKFLFFDRFLLVLVGVSFWSGDWALGYHSLDFRHFPDIS